MWCIFNMEIYSLENIEIVILKSPLLLQFNNLETKNLLLDKHKFVLNLIISNNIQCETPLHYFSNINSLKLKKYLGDRHYKIIIQNLVEIGIITVNNSYSSGSHSKSYALTKQIIKKHPITKSIIKSNKYNSKLKTQAKLEFDEIVSNELFYKILVNTSRLKFFPEYPHFIPTPQIEKFIETDEGEITVYEDNTLQIQRYFDFSQSLKRFNEIESIESIYSDNMFYKPSQVESGRIYHMASSIPRLVRQCLRTKNNDLLYEIDMSSAQPSLLFLEYLKHLYSGENIISEKERKEAEIYLKIVLDGVVYNYIQENSDFLKNLTYKDLKKSILTTLNAKRNNSKLNTELKKIFPFFMSWVNNIKKKHGHKKISSIAQTAEANIFVQVYSEIDIDVFALIIHDCIITKLEHTIEIKQKLINRLIFTYPEILNEENDLTSLFKISIVSLKDDEFPSYLAYQATI